MSSHATAPRRRAPLRAFLGALGLAHALGLASLTGCAAHAPLTPPPPPLRPEAEPAPAAAGATARKDCDALDPNYELKAIGYEQRSITEATKLAEQAKAKLRIAESSESDRATRELNLTASVDDFITALRADPYNVTATYNLAAAYARIGREQCSLNLLTRLVQLRGHPSKRAEVELHFDRLLGRRGALDPDFAELRRDDRFRQLIARMCEGVADASCGH